MVNSIGSSDSFANYMMMAGSMAVDAETGEGVIIDSDGTTTKVPSEEVAQMLAAAGFMIQDGKLTTLDKIEKSPASVNAATSIGSAPPLSQVTTTATISDVRSSAAMLAVAQSIQENALLMTALLVLMRGAEDDRVANDKIGNTMFKMKDLAKQGQITQGREKAKADLEAAKEAYRNAMISGAVQIVTSAASAATAGMSGLAAGLVGIGTAVANAATSITTAKLNEKSAKEGAVRQAGEHDKNVSIFKQVEENCQSVIDMTKESGDACREMWKAALKLLSSMEQRATQNVQAFTRI